jgi:hypothetical protein
MEGLLFNKVQVSMVFYLKIVDSTLVIILVNLIHKIECIINPKIAHKHNFNTNKILRVDDQVSSTIKVSIKISLTMVLISVRFMDKLNQNLLNKEQFEIIINFRTSKQIS